MNHFSKQLIPLLFTALLFATACTEQKASTQEQIEIKTMDSTSRSIKETSDKLEDQTKKVEASLEKLDSEFKDNQ